MATCPGKGECVSQDVKNARKEQEEREQGES